MSRRSSLLGFVVTILTIMAGGLSAGGWAVVSVENVPHVFDVGVPVRLTFAVRQHGFHLTGGLSPTVQAVSGATVVRAAASAAAETGRYEARLQVPHAGDWVVTIDSGFGSNSKLMLLPIAAVAPKQSAGVAPTPAEIGRRLFVAKGCVTCHQNSIGSGSASIGIAPALVAQKYQPAFLARILADPAAALPPRNGQPAMPDLGLQPQEIDSLVAFITTPAVTASR